MSRTGAFWCVAALGDVNPVEHGGQFCMVDRQGIYPPELEVWDPDRNLWYSFAISRCYRIGDTNSVSDNVYHPKLPAWFGTEEAIGSLASFMGWRPSVLVARFADADPVYRAEAYLGAFRYYSTDNFDSQPIRPTKREVVRWCRQLKAQANKAENWPVNYLNRDGSI